jgi:hydroxymethylglutaryl-CoA lyase
MSRLPTHVTLVEVGPRDGLQNEKQPVSTAHKLELIAAPAGCWLREIEATSFVSPKWVPQMADAGAVMAGNAGLRRPGSRYSVLVPNDKGWTPHCRCARTRWWSSPPPPRPSASKNINCSIAESIERFGPWSPRPRRRASRCAALSCCLGCPYEGEVSADEVERVAALMKRHRRRPLGVADTIGVGTPRRCRPRWRPRCGTTRCTR